jgi:hypothetical protein
LASALQGAGIGAAQYANPGESKLTNAAFGAGGGFLGSGAGQLGNAAIRKGAEKYAQSAMPGLVAKATDKIKGYISPEELRKSCKLILMKPLQKIRRIGIKQTL